VLGVNFYPWSNHRLVRRRDGQPRRVADSPATALADVLRMVHGRYDLPVMVTETSAPGSHADRDRWMRETVAAVRHARGAGVPVVGYTWFPMFTMVEWKYRWSRKGMEHHLLHLGLFDVEPRDRQMDRAATPLVAAYRELLADPVATIGEWSAAPALAFDSAADRVA
jgi:hypothetical protein